MEGKVLAIVSPKGGTGKTVTTANLAATLSTYFNKKILAIDTNITTASLGLHFNLLYPKITIYDVLKKGYLLESAFFPYNHNLYIIPASITIEKSYKNPYALQDILRMLVNHYDILLSQVVKDFDLILLDSAPGFNIEAVATMRVADAILIVTNPEYPAIVATTKTIEYAKILKVPIIGIVLNKVTHKDFEPTKSQLEKLFGIKIIQEIPFDYKVIESIANRKPISIQDPENKISNAYKKIAASLFEQEYELNLWQRIKRFFKK